MRIIHNENVYGLAVDAESRCSHWYSDLDIVAIRFKCCGRWFPCFECHSVVADHKPKTWAKDERGVRAVLCGGCGYQLGIAEYFACDSTCPNCGSGFNPGCANHSELYFD